MTTRRIKLPFEVKNPILACGADLKGAFAFAKGDEAFLVDGFGDLSDLDNFTKYGQAVKKYQTELKIKPQIITHDLHPNYFSTRFAENFARDAKRGTLYAVQHHEAHIASSIVDNNIKGDVIGVAFDGTGYGSDGNIWGGEFFVGGLKSFERVAHLEYVPMPGGDIAVKEPWRMAVSYLYRVFGAKLPSIVERWDAGKVSLLKKMIGENINCPITSSAGRLFDAVGSLILGKDTISKEAELPIELEKIISSAHCGTYEFDLRKDGEKYIIYTSDIIKGVVKDLDKGEAKSVISCKFHNAVTDIIFKTISALSKEFKTRQVCLSGGVFQNRYLISEATKLLEAAGFRVYTHSGVSTNDSGIPIGQLAIARERAICV